MAEEAKPKWPAPRRYNVTRKLRRAQIVNVCAGVAVVVLALSRQIPAARAGTLWFALAWCFIVVPVALEFAIRWHRKKSGEAEARQQVEQVHQFMAERKEKERQTEHTDEPGGPD
jgi:hypothetical protein